MGEFNQQKFVEWFGRVEDHVSSARMETTRAMDEIQRQLKPRTIPGDSLGAIQTIKGVLKGPEADEAIATISDQLRLPNISDKSVAEGLTGLLNRSYAAIVATQDQLEELKTSMEAAGMLPPAKATPEKKGGKNGVGQAGP